jgi:hypothetical protein
MFLKTYRSTTWEQYRTSIFEGEVVKASSHLLPQRWRSDAAVYAQQHLFDAGTTRNAHLWIDS